MNSSCFCVAGVSIGRWFSMNIISCFCVVQVLQTKEFTARGMVLQVDIPGQSSPETHLFLDMIQNTKRQKACSFLLQIFIHSERKMFLFLIEDWLIVESSKHVRNLQILGFLLSNVPPPYVHVPSWYWPAGTEYWKNHAIYVSAVIVSAVIVCLVSDSEASCFQAIFTHTRMCTCMYMFAYQSSSHSPSVSWTYKHFFLQMRHNFRVFGVSAIMVMI